jgi:hypothetical protein
MKRLLAISLIATGVAISAHAAPLGAKTAHNAVSPVELRKLFPGRFSAIVKGYQVRFVASAGGRLTGHYGAMTDKGRWSLRGTKLCVMLRDWLDGKTTCARVRREKGRWFRASGIRFRKM